MLVMDQGTWKWNWIFGNLPGCKPWMQGFLFIYLSNFLTYLDHGRNGTYILSVELKDELDCVCCLCWKDGWWVRRALSLTYKASLFYANLPTPTQVYEVFQSFAASSKNHHWRKRLFQFIFKTRYLLHTLLNPRFFGYNNPYLGKLGNSIQVPDLSLKNIYQELCMVDAFSLL